MWNLKIHDKDGHGHASGLIARRTVNQIYGRRYGPAAPRLQASHRRKPRPLMGAGIFIYVLKYLVLLEKVKKHSRKDQCKRKKASTKGDILTKMDSGARPGITSIGRVFQPNSGINVWMHGVKECERSVSFRAEPRNPCGQDVCACVFTMMEIRFHFFQMSQIYSA